MAAAAAAARRQCDEEKILWREWCRCETDTRRKNGEDLAGSLSRHKQLPAHVEGTIGKYHVGRSK